MTHLIKTEWLKIRKYKAFWWLMGIVALSYPGINYIFYLVYDTIVNNPNEAGQLAKIYIGNPFTFPDVWHTVAYFSSWFLFIPAVLVIMFITNEYSFKTHRQNIIDGWSRREFLTAKMMNVLITSLIITALFTIVSLVMGFANQKRLIQDTWGQSYFTGLFALQTFSQLSVAFLIGFLVRKAFISLGIFIFYFFPFEPILTSYLKAKAHDEGRFFPLEVSDRLIPHPAFVGKIDPEAYKISLAAISTHVWLTLIFTAVVWFICFWINGRRDL
jgi:ABC-2 type transport system permease protein